MHKVSSLLLLLAFCVALVGAQTASQHIHPNASPVIDGKVHPEQISMTTAYRLVMLTMSLDADSQSEEHHKRQLSHLGRLGLSPADFNKSLLVLQIFRSSYDAHWKTYNAAATAAHSFQELPDTKAFRAQRRNLVDSTRDMLKAQLSPEGMAKWDAFVEHEKAGMRVAPEVSQ